MRPIFKNIVSSVVDLHSASLCHTTGVKIIKQSYKKSCPTTLIVNANMHYTCAVIAV